ncbi:MAG: hypothetical protein E7665_02810 [Ruminococcaceae bacterium]|nr:hypothetical protein [Oscillospiraceae bacterium]
MTKSEFLSDAPICSMLEKYRKISSVRLHMPGHGGKAPKLFDGAYEYLDALMSVDVTEICETDDLLCPEGCILESERKCARMYGASDSFFSCQGATLCIQTAIFTVYKLKRQMKNREVTFLCDRMCHKSVVNAMSLLGIEPEWFDPRDASTYKKSDAVIVTTVSYYGEVFRSFEALKSFFDNDTVFIADNSHGSHLYFTELKGFHPLSCGFDLVIDSVHKTLPSMTGTAILHTSFGFLEKTNNSRESIRENILSSMRVFSSTSPNFVLLASVDAALAYVRSRLTDGIFDDLKHASSLIKQVGNVFGEQYSFLTDDPMRAVLRGKIDFEKLSGFLASKGIFCEFYTESELVMLFPYSFSEKEAAILTEAFASFFSEKENASAISERIITNKKKAYSFPKKGTSLKVAMVSNWETVPVSEAEGRISAEVYAPYPPGIPAVVPGEIFGREECERLKKQFPKVRVLKN